MRPRNKKHLDERFNRCIHLTAESPMELKGNWRSIFDSESNSENESKNESEHKNESESESENESKSEGKSESGNGRTRRPLWLEIGCGKGAFVTGMAAAHPDIDFIAIECVKNVLVTALERTAASGLNNIRFVLINASILSDLFAPDEIDMIYLNFSDPWPRKKQAKHRLTHSSFLKAYETVLAPGGHIVQKTDNTELFTYSIESFTENGWRLENVTYDLHGPDTPQHILDENIVTEYERRFMENGVPIKRLEAFPPDSSLTALI